MAEEKCFCWLDTATKPAHEIIVVYARFETLRVQFDQDFEKSEIEIFLLRCAKVLGERFSCDVSTMVVIDS